MSNTTGQRWYIQKQIGPLTRTMYTGLGSANIPITDPLGNPIIVPSDSKFNSFDIAGFLAAPPAVLTGTMTFPNVSFSMYTVLQALFDGRCEFNGAVLAGDCGSPTTLMENWEQLTVYKKGRATTRGGSDVNTPDSAAQSNITADATFTRATSWHRLTCSAIGDATIDVPVKGAVWLDDPDCGDCGGVSDGAQRFYALLGASGTDPASLVYTNNGGNTVTEYLLSSLTANSADKIAVLNSRYLIVLSDAANAHVAIAINKQTGAPESNTLVTGYAATKNPTCIFRRSQNEAYIGGKGGYIYYVGGPTLAPVTKSAGTITTQNINAIHGADGVIVAVGDSNAVVMSDNNFLTGTSITGPNVGQNLTTVWVMGKQKWLIGDAQGKLWYTPNQGGVWTQIGSLNMTRINDIQFTDGDTMGYVVGESATAGVVAWTIDSSATLTDKSPRFNNVPAHTKCNFIAPNPHNDNIVLFGGANSTDGRLILALPPQLTYSSDN